LYTITCTSKFTQSTHTDYKHLQVGTKKHAASFMMGSNLAVGMAPF